MNEDEAGRGRRRPCAGDVRVTSDVLELYRQVILEHNRRQPRNRYG